jgi:hypothetical protein
MWGGGPWKIQHKINQNGTAYVLHVALLLRQRIFMAKPVLTFEEDEKNCTHN